MPRDQYYYDIALNDKTAGGFYAFPRRLERRETMSWQALTSKAETGMNQLVASVQEAGKRTVIFS